MSSSASTLEIAEARAARNGLTLEVGDEDAGTTWPGTRYLFVRLMRGRERIASMTRSYRSEAGREQALSFCLRQVYNRPE